MSGKDCALILAEDGPYQLVEIIQEIGENRLNEVSVLDVCNHVDADLRFLHFVDDQLIELLHGEVYSQVVNWLKLSVELQNLCQNRR